VADHVLHVLLHIQVVKYFSWVVILKQDGIAGLMVDQMRPGPTTVLTPGKVYIPSG